MRRTSRIVSEDTVSTLLDAHTSDAERKVAAEHGAQRPQKSIDKGEGEIILARNPNGATVNPAKLPETVQMALDSPYPDLRKGAVAVLGTWLGSDDASRVLAAQRVLERVASQDISLVAAEASRQIQTVNTAILAKGKRAKSPTEIASPTNSPPITQWRKRLNTTAQVF